MTPACWTNGLNGVDALCTQAITGCPEGMLRFWVWQREVTVTRDPYNREPGPWRQLPGSYCLGPDDPGVPDYAGAIAQVIRGFRNLPLPRAAVEVAPAPTSLVQVATAFYAGGEQSFEQTVAPLPQDPGFTVTVRARPTSWTWHWGDGTNGTFGTAGEPRRPVVAHTYRQARDHTAHVEVSWKGEFTFTGSSQWIEIPTPVVVRSGDVTVQVREARTELVDG